MPSHLWVTGLLLSGVVLTRPGRVTRVVPPQPALRDTAAYAHRTNQLLLREHGDTLRGDTIWVETTRSKLRVIQRGDTFSIRSTLGDQLSRESQWVRHGHVATSNTGHQVRTSPAARLLVYRKMVDQSKATDSLMRSIAGGQPE